MGITCRRGPRRRRFMSVSCGVSGREQRIRNVRRHNCFTENQMLWCLYVNVSHVWDTAACSSGCRCVCQTANGLVDSTGRSMCVGSAVESRMILELPVCRSWSAVGKESSSTTSGTLGRVSPYCRSTHGYRYVTHRPAFSRPSTLHIVCDVSLLGEPLDRSTLGRGILSHPTV